MFSISSQRFVVLYPVCLFLVLPICPVGPLRRGSVITASASWLEWPLRTLSFSWLGVAEFWAFSISMARFSLMICYTGLPSLSQGRSSSLLTLVLIVYINAVLACACTWFLVLGCSAGAPVLSWPIEGFCLPHNRGWCEALAPEVGLGCAYPTG